MEFKEYTTTGVDPNTLYTQETRVYASGLQNVNLSEPVLLGVDASGHYYITNGNHRAVQALREGKRLTGHVISKMNTNVTMDPDFRLVSELKVI